jgi:phosphoribosylformimino-5-aminoimidazole carboxamide ribotide isomerase
MIVIPAIDIKEGKVVRLSQGKFNEVTIYSDNPAETAKHWEIAGASLLHVVDLDGAEHGEMRNVGWIEQIIKAIKIPIQVGGGIRTKQDIERLLASGVSRVILGTKVVEDREFLKEILSQWQKKITVSLDCARGVVTQRGWTSVSQLKATDFAKELQLLGLQQLIYTDISRDGMLMGPNIKTIREFLQSVSIPVIASGGISQLEDITNLKKLTSFGLCGVIVGKALYERRLYLKDAIEICSRKE